MDAYSSPRKSEHKLILYNFLIQDFAANSDQDSVVTYDFNPPIRTRYIHFRPKTWHRNISMRVELYGCRGNYQSFNSVPLDSLLFFAPAESSFNKSEIQVIHYRFSN